MRRFRWLIPLAAFIALWTSISLADAFGPPNVQQISSDPYTNLTSQHKTEVEPDTFAFGDTVVAAFQAGRFVNGAASNIGFATSIDAGETWTDGFLPSLTEFSDPPGEAGRATDPSVAYDSKHDVWLISSLTCPASTCFLAPIPIVVSRSEDGGMSWGAPVTVDTAVGNDKNWIVCDNGDSSKHKGNCYVAWSGGAGIKVSRSTNGGKNWSKPVSADGMRGVQPVVQPDGDLVIIGGSGFEMIAVRSTNGGASFDPHVTVATGLDDRQPTGMRAPLLPSAEVAADGKIHVVWQDCRFRKECRANDIVMSTSEDGINWSDVDKIDIPGDFAAAGEFPFFDYFIPGIAVDPTFSDRLALTFYYYPRAFCDFSNCELFTGVVFSINGGDNWFNQHRLAGPMSLSWIADTGGDPETNRMVGDYISTSFAGGRAVSVFSKATDPTRTGDAFNQFMASSSITLAARFNISKIPPDVIKRLLDLPPLPGR